MAASKPGYDLNSFEVYWASLDTETQADLIARAGFFSPEIGILPILKGYTSYHFNVRNAARQSLDELVLAIQKKLAFPRSSKDHAQGRQEVLHMGGRIYHALSPDLPFADLCFLLKTLLSLGDKGAFFAFKALYQNRISTDVMKKSIQAVGEYEQLIFVDQYLQAPPAVRLKYADLFTGILSGIKKRKPVIAFYAWLFDGQRDPDPFLNHIRPGLRDPEMIIDTEITSQSPEIRIQGLKALSMIQSKIPARILEDVLQRQEVKKIRLAVYQLVENSAMGRYPEVFDAIYSHLNDADAKESVCIFKALVLTGKMPVHRLMTRLRKDFPDILPSLYTEISTLSRISFFIIQDIALNKDAYLADNFEVNQACIFGMIKKRPERVIQILKAFEEGSAKAFKLNMSGFVKKTSLLLKKEKMSIAADFNRLVKKLDGPEPEKGKGFLQSVLRDPVEKKLEALVSGTATDPIDFSDLSIRNQDFSGQVLTGPPTYFTGTVIQDCDLAGAKVANAVFTRAVFYNVTLADATFDRIRFDHAIFINVDGRKARFNRCSFHGASFLNCNFNDADLSDSLFTQAHVARTTFARTDLTCACFADARLSGITFATANLAMADFSGVKARFSRFPAYIRTLIRNEDIDYNAREFQLGFQDLPPIDKTVVAEINMLIFCEFIHYGEQKFLNQNKLSLVTAFDIFKPAQSDFFQLLPLLIHTNAVLPDMDPFPMSTPCGISDYLPSRETLAVGEKYLGRKNMVAQGLNVPEIQGIFSMGSVGSLAQTAESDIDYWICIDEQEMDKEGVGLLRRKLDRLETLALEKFKIHVTFFMVDILKARNNDFGGSTQESSGSAQSRLLKEEFYRTMIHVAGKLPLWAVLPTTISINYYNLILDRISRVTHSHRYIDLGDIHAIPVNEYFGASIWQMFKWLKSPFKSVIKMALLEKYIQAYGQETLLCNQYKNEWMNSGTHLKPGQNDSYIILLNNLIDFYRKAGDQTSVNLLLTCFFLKLGIARQKELETIFGMRRILLEVTLAEWKWGFNKIFEIGRFKIWPYAAIQRLSLTIERYMVSKYADLKQRFDTRSMSGLMISEDDRVVLERKVNVVFQSKPNKIKQLLLVSRGDRHFSRLHLKYLPVNNHPGRWELVHKIPRHRDQTEESIITADTIEEIGAWLINNRLYTDQTYLGLIPNPSSVSHEQIEKLFKAMYEVFAPEMKKNVHFKALRAQPVITRLFISMNFYARKQQTQVTDYTVIYLNSWGEMYLRSSRPETAISGLQEAKQRILKGLALKHFPEKTVVYTAGAVSRL